jgi:hypothetical protein
MPQGFTGSFDDLGNMAVSSQGSQNSQYTQYRTFLQFNFSPTGADVGTYPQFQTGNQQVSNLQGLNNSTYAGTSGSGGAQSNTPAYGPSSGHSGVVVHLMADGSVHSLSKTIDVSAYMFLITRNGSDPIPTIP